jgi:hypothetical protein
MGLHLSSSSLSKEGEAQAVLVVSFVCQRMLPLGSLQSKREKRARRRRERTYVLVIHEAMSWDEEGVEE